jgi:hypothetical protein
MGQALNANLLRSSRTRTRKVHQACYKNVSLHAHAHFGYCKTRMFLRARTASPGGPSTTQIQRARAASPMRFKHNRNTERSPALLQKRLLHAHARVCFCNQHTVAGCRVDTWGRPKRYSERRNAQFLACRKSEDPQRHAGDACSANEDASKTLCPTLPRATPSALLPVVYV